MADPQWADIAAAGGIREWVDAEIAKQGLVDPGVPTSDGEKKAYKARRDEERRVRRTLHKQAWAAYRRAHVVHLGPGVWWHDTADVDRFDADDPDKARRDRSLENWDVDAFAKAVGLPIVRLRWLAYHRDVDAGTHYHRWLVPKRDGTPRGAFRLDRPSAARRDGRHAAAAMRGYAASRARRIERAAFVALHTMHLRGTTPYDLTIGRGALRARRDGRSAPPSSPQDCR